LCDVEYREISAPPSLTGHLVCLWTGRQSLEPGAEVNPVVPDGCVDIVWVAGKSPIVAGPDTGPAPVKLDPGAVLAAARFHPGCAPALLGMAASDLRDLRIPLEDVWGMACSRELVESNVCDSAGMLERLVDALEKRLHIARPLDPAVRVVVSWASRPEPFGFHELSRRVGVSERQLRRRVEDHIGYGPTMLRRVLRFQRLLGLVSRPRPLAHLALEAGYADQAHMTREVGRLAGTTPRRLMGETFNR
jgi:AraC-like DNA-binding protein